MWSAVSFRMRDHGSTRSPGQGSTVAGAGKEAGTRGGGEVTARSDPAPGATGSAPPRFPASPPSMYPRMSFLVTRPARPVPETVLMSRLCSAAILRTSGVDLRRRRSSAVSEAPLPPVASLTARGSGAGAAEAAAGVAALAGADDLVEAG